MHQALYRKYRPAVFDDVCGQKHVTDVLRYEIQNGKISHAYLFCGSRGTGKTSCAKILAKAVNCENPKNGSPCLSCAACKDIDAGLTTDVIEMDAASHNSVEDIRSLCDEIMYTPSVMKKKVYIIDEVHMLSPGAFNALLKTIEEPPEHAVFILATTELHKVPATIVSRCQRFSFNRVNMASISARLKYIAEKEGIVLEDEAAQLLAKQAQGGMRDAIGLFELCSAGGADVTGAKVSDTLGLSGYETVAECADAIHSSDMQRLFGIVDKVYSSAKDISVFWQELTAFFRDMLVSKYTEDSGEYLDLTAAETEILKNAASKFSLSQLVFMSKVLDETTVRLSRSPGTKRMTAEMALLRLCRPELDSSPEALSARVAKLEDAMTLGSFTPPAAFEKVPEKEEKTVIIEKAEKPAEKKAEIPLSPTDNTDETAGYRKVSDISEAVGRLQGADRSIAQYLMSAEVYISKDKRRVILYSENIALDLLSTESSRAAVANCFAVAHITDGKASVEVKKKKQNTAPASPADDLGGLI